MSAHAVAAPAADNTRPAVDKVVQDIADYVHDYEINSDLAVRYSIPPCGWGKQIGIDVWCGPAR